MNAVFALVYPTRRTAWRRRGRRLSWILRLLCVRDSTSSKTAGRGGWVFMCVWVWAIFMCVWSWGCEHVHVHLQVRKHELLMRVSACMFMWTWACFYVCEHDMFVRTWACLCACMWARHIYVHVGMTHSCEHGLVYVHACEPDTFMWTWACLCVGEQGMFICMCMWV